MTRYAVLPKSKTETARRLNVLADYMLTVRPERLVQSSYVSEPVLSRGVLDPSPSCNTSACAAGWATTIKEFQDAGLYLDHLGDPTIRLEGVGLVWFSTALTAFFGISYPEAQELFGFQDVTPRQKSKQLRDVAKRYQ